VPLCQNPEFISGQLLAWLRSQSRLEV